MNNHNGWKPKLLFADEGGQRMEGGPALQGGAKPWLHLYLSTGLNYSTPLLQEHIEVHTSSK